MTKNKAIELLKSGNFTILYHDNGDWRITKGHKKYEQVPCGGQEVRFYDECGYAPPIVLLLVEALGGKVDSV